MSASRGAAIRRSRQARSVLSVAMAKAFSLFLALCMVVQVIRPLGLPGLRRRADAWKLAAGIVVITMAVAVLSTG